MTTIDSFKRLSDEQLLDESKRLMSCERQATTTLIALLAELDARRLYLGQGCSSLFTYCTQVLRLSEHAAYGRIEAARIARRLPVVLDLLADGSVTLTTLCLLGPHLTETNHRQLLDAARHKSKRDVERQIAALNPGLPTRWMQVVWPLTSETYSLQLTISRDTYEKLSRAQDLLRHRIPSGDLSLVFDRAITTLLEHLERRKAAITARPHAGRPSTPGSRHIPAAVRREVWARDAGRCAFIGAYGRCTETGFLEFHHVEPYAVGGKAVVANIQLRCASHNRYEATLCFELRSETLRELAEHGNGGRDSF